MGPAMANMNMINSLHKTNGFPPIGSMCSSFTSNLEISKSNLISKKWYFVQNDAGVSAIGRWTPKSKAFCSATNAGLPLSSVTEITPFDDLRFYSNTERPIARHPSFSQKVIVSTDGDNYMMVDLDSLQAISGNQDFRYAFAPC